MQIVDKPLQILYQDQHLIAVNKPSGLLVHRSMIAKHETQFAMQMVRDQIGQHVYPAHRLDRPTSGVLLFALSSEVARQLSPSFEQKRVTKSYLALVRGWITEAGILDYPLKEQHDRYTDAQAEQNKAAQAAVTRYQPLQRIELPYALGRYSTVRYTWLKLFPETGRKHQLRRHMAHLRHPIIGDTTHGDGKQNQFFWQQFAHQRLMLHACEMQLPYPGRDELLTVKAPLPTEWFGLNELQLATVADCQNQTDC